MKPDHRLPVARSQVRFLEITEDAGQRIDNFLIRTLKNVPRSRVYRMLRKGEVRVNGGRVKPTYRLHAGDKVRIPPHTPGREFVSGNPGKSFVGSVRLAKIERSIIFEDDDLLVLNKPQGVAVHGGSGVSFGVIEAVRRLRPQGRLELAHRLDRDTSGCLIISKRRSALSRIHASIRAGTMSKHYVLMVHGCWPQAVASVRLPLSKRMTASGERRVRVDPGGKASRTDFQIESSAANATILTAQLYTGRTHQIRVHAAASGHAVIGDSKYASPEDAEVCERLGLNRLCLHAAEIVLPWDGGERRFVSPRPESFASFWSRLS